jgi:hypothetical protein
MRLAATAGTRGRRRFVWDLNAGSVDWLFNTDPHYRDDQTGSLMRCLHNYNDSYSQHVPRCKKVFSSTRHYTSEKGWHDRSSGEHTNRPGSRGGANTGHTPARPSRTTGQHHGTCSVAVVASCSRSYFLRRSRVWADIDFSSESANANPLAIQRQPCAKALTAAIAL